MPFRSHVKITFRKQWPLFMGSARRFLVLDDTKHSESAKTLLTGSLYKNRFFSASYTSPSNMHVLGDLLPQSIKNLISRDFSTCSRYKDKIIFL